ncbi:MAG: signal peptidase I [Pseudomonadota bacterium]
MTETTAAAEKPTLKDRVIRELKEWGSTFAVFIPLFFVFSLLLYEQRVIPSESMVPNLQVGDRVVVNKFAYGYSRYSVPWGVGRILPLGEGRLFKGEPKRGDVVVFMHPHFRRVMIKRVVGMPGDRIEIRGERVILNDEEIPTSFARRHRYIPHGDSRPETAQEFRETIGDKTVLVHQLRKGQSGDNTPVFVVPQGHYFFMGDNRDNSKDARDLSGHCPANAAGVIDQAGCEPRVPARDASVGFVPLDHLIGRAETVLFTTKRCRRGDGLDCPPKRLWRGL